MRIAVFIATLMAVAAAFAGSSRADEPVGVETTWYTDFDAARSRAAESDKDLFIAALGSDWSALCIALRKEVLRDPEFISGAGTEFVLVELDYPDSKDQDDALKKQNAKLRIDFGFDGFPTLLLADKHGRIFGHLPNQPGITAGQCIAQMKGLRQQRVKRDKLLDEATETEGLDRAKKLHAALKTLDEEIASRFYGDLLDEIVALDPDDTLKVKGDRAFGKALTTLKKEIYGKAQTGDHDSISSSIDEFIAQRKLAGSQKQQAMMLKLGLYRPDQLNEVLAFLDNVVKIKVDSAPGREADEIRSRVRQYRDQRQAAKSAQE